MQQYRLPVNTGTVWQYATQSYDENANRNLPFSQLQGCHGLYSIRQQVRINSSDAAFTFTRVISGMTILKILF